MGFLLPSVLVYIVHHTLSGRMTLKVIVILCLVLVGLIEANPVSMEVTELPDGEPDETSDIGFTNNEDTTEDSDYEVDGGMDNALQRNKRSPCRVNPLKREFCLG